MKYKVPGSLVKVRTHSGALSFNDNKDLDVGAATERKVQSQFHWTTAH